ncbi:hypothetical protein GCM10022225_40630 [Plantactinospora mayteni]|uniref:SH3b domain-containing protein n=1 Tax=Plantactinospora mayteni TaxID=566021 RepID=A0ABQ4ETV1_9ACTN|nr:SH3 domain-containing protein [Plantactinospora mayteni]GIG98087.1 hypothetical protein Pma05_46600 [Plantactinospora mayteni]
MKITPVKPAIVLVAAAGMFLVGAAPATAQPTTTTTKATTTTTTTASATAQDPVQILQMCTYEVTGDGVRLRTQPNNTSTVLGLLYRGDRVNGHWEENQNGFHLVYSSRHGKSGWVATAYLSLVSCVPGR